MMSTVKSRLRSFLWNCGLDVRLSRTTERTQKEKLAAENQAWLNKSWRTLLRYRARTVLDIGANDGAFAGLVREIDPDIKIISFEPLEDCFHALERTFEKIGNAHAFQVALGDEPGMINLQRNSWSASSSFLRLGELHRREWPTAVETRPEPVRIGRLDDMSEALSLITPPFIVKLDVQGFEDRVLRGAIQTLRRAVAVVVESSSYAMYEGQAPFDDTYEFLKALGFIYRGNVEQCFSHQDRRIIQFDALFDNPLLIST